MARRRALGKKEDRLGEKPSLVRNARVGSGGGGRAAAIDFAEDGGRSAPTEEARMPSSPSSNLGSADIFLSLTLS